jgi:predicted nucleotidyltransferase
MPTALQLSRKEWQPYIDAARQRPAPVQPTEAELRARDDLLDRVRQVAAQLKICFGAQRVMLFGSLADPSWFSVDSDVDLAVGGLAPESYWQAWGLAEEILADRLVDLIEIETASPSLLQAIQQYGIEL